MFALLSSPLTMDRLYLALSTFCFLGGFAYIIAALRTGNYHPPRWNLAAMIGGFVFLNLFLYERGLVHKRCPITNILEILVFIGWAMVLIYLFFGTTYRLSLLGLFTAPLVFVFQIAAILAPFDREAALKAAAEHGAPDPWVEIHISVSLLAYGAFAMAFVAGVMFLVQDHMIRSHNLKAMFYNLPPVQNLSQAIQRLLILGFILLTVGIVSAQRIEQVSQSSKLVVIYAMWIIYAGLLAFFWIRGLSPKRLALGAILAFIIPALSLAFISHT